MMVDINIIQKINDDIEKDLIKSQFEENSKEFALKLEFLYKNIKKSKGLQDVDKFKQKVLNACKFIKPRFHYTLGNAKLPKSTMIINLGSWFCCPGRYLGFCDIEEICYDKQIEVRYHNIMKYRFEQELYLKSMPTKYIVNDILNALNKNKNKKINLIRWAEVGEIDSQEFLEKINDICTKIGEKTGIHSYIYTHNQLLDFNIDRPFLTINGSNFMVDNEYKLIEKGTTENEFNTLSDIVFKKECICDCTRCSLCSSKNRYTIIEELR